MSPALRSPFPPLCPLAEAGAARSTTITPETAQPSAVTERTGRSRSPFPCPISCIMPEFSAQALDSLRAPLETGEVMVARANAHIRYPARVQLVAAMNPCRCGRWRPLGRGAPRTRAALHPGLPVQGLRPAARPDRPSDRSAAGHRGRSGLARPGRRQRRSRRPHRPGPRPAGRPGRGDRQRRPTQRPRPPWRRRKPGWTRSPP